MADAYDEIPYPSLTFPETRPGRLGVHAAFFGLAAAPAATCRFLEIGAGDGANIIPMALTHPGARFVGFDRAGGPVSRAQADIAALGLSNIDFRRADILDVDLGDEAFDYIVAHGVYAWTPIAVRDAMMRLIGRHLAPEGVAYVSYNALPGGYVRLAIRDELLFAVRDVKGRAARLAATRARMMELAQPPADNHPFLVAVATRAREMLGHDPNTLAHDELNDDYNPVYLHDFSDHCRANGLKVLGDASHDGAGVWFSPYGAVAVDEDEVIDRVQRVDLDGLESFRQSLIVRDGRPIDRHFRAERLLALHAAAGVKVDPQGQFMFEGRPVEVTDPSLRPILARLAALWPLNAPVRDLASGPAQLDGLMRLYLAGIVEFVLRPGDAPKASPLARLQAAREEAYATTLAHTRVPLDPFTRGFIGGLDGVRTRHEIAADLAPSFNLSVEAALPRLEIALELVGRSPFLVR
jgi:protein-L-isoaspartate O-methyltransferase